MPRFRYSAIGQDGATQPGVIEAPDERAAVLALREQGKLPVRVEPDAPKGAIGRLLAAEFAWRRGLGAADVAEAIHELATMLAAGQDLDRARYATSPIPRQAAPRGRASPIYGNPCATAHRSPQHSSAIAPASPRSASPWCAPARRAAASPRRWSAWL